MDKYNEIKVSLTRCGEKFAELTGDVDFGSRIIRAFDEYYRALGYDLSGLRGLDIGAGKGAALIAALTLGADFVVGIDRSFDEFGNAKMPWRDLCALYGVDYSKSLFLQGNIPMTAFKEESFDFVSLIDVIEHVPDPKTFIDYGIEHLADGGVLILDTCPLFFSPAGHHLFSYFDRIKAPWAHLRSDFDQALAQKKVDSWSLERFYELNKCQYKDLKEAISCHDGIFIVDLCPQPEELLELYDLNKSLVDPSGSFGAELLCQEWVSIVWMKNQNIGRQMSHYASYAGSHPQLHTQCGQQYGVHMKTLGAEGILLFGPYVNLPIGRYSMKLFGQANHVGTPCAYFEVANNTMGEILASKCIAESMADTVLAAADFSLIAPSLVEVRVWVAADADISIRKLVLLSEQDFSG